MSQQPNFSPYAPNGPSHHQAPPMGAPQSPYSPPPMGSRAVAPQPMPPQAPTHAPAQYPPRTGPVPPARPMPAPMQPGPMPQPMAPAQWTPLPRFDVRVLGALVAVLGAVLAIVSIFLPFVAVDGMTLSVGEAEEAIYSMLGSRMGLERVLLWVGPVVTILGVLIAVLMRHNPKAGTIIAGVGVMIMGFSGAYWPIMLLPQGGVGAWLLLVAFLISLAGLVRLAYQRH